MFQVIYREHVYDMEKAEKEMEAISDKVTYHVLKDHQEMEHSMPPPLSSSSPKLPRNEDDSPE